MKIQGIDASRSETLKAKERNFDVYFAVVVKQVFFWP
jgi:hypothetical protein